MPSIDDFEKIYGLALYDPEERIDNEKFRQQREKERFLKHPVTVVTDGMIILTDFQRGFNILTTPHEDTMAAFFLDSQDPDDDDFLPWLDY